MIVKLYLPWEAIPSYYSEEQMRSALQNGCSVGGYAWCYRSADPAETVRQALKVFWAAAGRYPPVLWLDVETYNPSGSKVEDPGPDAGWLVRALSECIEEGVQGGIYTAGWYWRAYMEDSVQFSDFPLWAAAYNGLPDLESVPLFGGWEREMLWGHQYAADGVDMNVFRSVGA